MTNTLLGIACLIFVASGCQNTKTVPPDVDIIRGAGVTYTIPKDKRTKPGQVLSIQLNRMPKVKFWDITDGALCFYDKDKVIISQYFCAVPGCAWHSDDGQSFEIFAVRDPELIKLGESSALTTLWADKPFEGHSLEDSWYTEILPRLDKLPFVKETR